MACRHGWIQDFVKAGAGAVIGASRVLHPSSQLFPHTRVGRLHHENSSQSFCLRPKAGKILRHPLITLSVSMLSSTSTPFPSTPFPFSPCHTCRWCCPWLTWGWGSSRASPAPLQLHSLWICSCIDDKGISTQASQEFFDKSVFFSLENTSSLVQELFLDTH